MAHVFRIGLTRLASPGSTNRLCKVSQNHNVVAVAFIQSKVKRTNLAPRPPPFPYWRKDLRSWHEVTDPMMYRFDENSKIITVEGLPAQGKKEFAKELAEKLDMLYMPPPTFDDLYINEYGEDHRVIDSQLPANAQTCDVERFLRDPHHINVANFQLAYFHMRLEQYMNAILHLLCTGQGVVLHRTYFSDPVFMRTMFKHGYISDEAFRVYLQIVNLAVTLLPRPHLVIYLDAPIKVIQEKIKKRNIDYEVQSKVLTTQYLTDLEQIYRDKFLSDIEDYSHVLVYDWSQKGDVNWVVDEIENLDFTSTTPLAKLGDWVFKTVGEVSIMRYNCQHKQKITRLFNQLYGLLPSEFYMPTHDKEVRDEVVGIYLHEKYKFGTDPVTCRDFATKIAKKDYLDTHYRRTVRDFMYRNPEWT